MRINLVCWSISGVALDGAGRRRGTRRAELGEREAQVHRLAPDEAAILLRTPLPLVGVLLSVVMERGCQQNDSLVRGYHRCIEAHCDTAFSVTAFRCLSLLGFTAFHRLSTLVVRAAGGPYQGSGGMALHGGSAGPRSPRCKYRLHP